MRNRELQFSLLTLALSAAFFAATTTARAEPTSSARGDKTEAAASNESRKTTERRKALPAHYGKIGVSEQQRAEIYQIQDQYEAKLKKLREELKALIAERDAKVEQKLTDDQKQQLKGFREKARANENARIKGAQAKK